MTSRRFLTFQQLRSYFYNTKHSNRTLFASSRQPSQPKDFRSRIRRLDERLPRFLRCYTTPLVGAPLTHATSFLILHEFTAIVPLFGLAAAFHYGNWMPNVQSEFLGEIFDDAVLKFGQWLRKRGWVEETNHADSVGISNKADSEQTQEERTGTARLALEFASAYVITKALLPIRIVVSVWATPWFAGTILVPASQGLRTLLRRY